jgi:hypothetical protein
MSPKMSKSDVLFALPAFLFAAYPFAVVGSINADSVFLDLSVAGRFHVVAWAIVGTALWGLRPIFRDFQVRAVWLSWLLAMIMFYYPAMTFGRARGMRFDVYTPAFAFLFTIAAVAIATLVTRPWAPRARTPWPLLVASVIVLGSSLGQWAMIASPFNSPAWQPPVDAIIRSVSATSNPPAPDRNIVYIVLDGFGSPKTLREHYGLDISLFVEFLRSKGFHVPEEAHSNYAQTYLSLASTLNMSYLDSVAKEMGPESTDRRPLFHLIQQNALMSLAKRAGYRTVAVGSSFQGTEYLANVDVCVCPQYGLDTVELAAIDLTPLAPLPRDRWTFDAHRRKVLSSFAAIQEIRTARQPSFMFAHIVTPHPPFVFGPDGSARRTRIKPFLFADGNQFPGGRSEYQAGYRDQMTFVIARTKAIIESLLSGDGPEPVIIVHGDHGPGLHLIWESAEKTNLEERLGIFAAYRFSGRPPVSQPISSPINGARALASQYFGANLASVHDESFFSGWEHPYDFRNLSTSDAKNVDTGHAAAHAGYIGH